MATKEQVVRRARRSYPVATGCWYFVREEKGGKSPSITTTEQACAAVREFWDRQPDTLQERMCVLTLDVKNQPIAWHIVTVGTLDATMAHCREIFRVAIMDSASRIIISHNHPSGNPEPGEVDIATTRRLAKAGAVLGIEVLDHIVAGDGCRSIREVRPECFAVSAS